MDSRKPGPRAVWTAMAAPIVAVIAFSASRDNGPGRRIEYRDFETDSSCPSYSSCSSWLNSRFMLFSCVCPDLHPHSIAVQRDLTVPVGSIDGCSRFGEARQYFRRGVAEGVAAAGADEGDLRAPGIEQRPRGRGAAAVVGDFQDTDRRRR